MFEDSLFDNLTEAEIRRVKAAAEARVAKIEQRLKEFVALQANKQEDGGI